MCESSVVTTVPPRTGGAVILTRGYVVGKGTSITISVLGGTLGRVRSRHRGMCVCCALSRTCDVGGSVRGRICCLVLATVTSLRAPIERCTSLRGLTRLVCRSKSVSHTCGCLDYSVRSTITYGTHLQFVRIARFFPVVSGTCGLGRRGRHTISHTVLVDIDLLSLFLLVTVFCLCH